MVMIVLVAIGGVAALLLLVDLTDFLLVRAGKRSIFSSAGGCPSATLIESDFLTLEETANQAHSGSHTG